MTLTRDTLRKFHEPFPAQKVHWRAQMVREFKEGASALALAYLNSRDVMDCLDRVCGPENWQCKHYDANGKMACSIGIFINEQWIWKSDGSGDTDIEAEKGAFSGALKRTAVLWGIGRYLYRLENTWVPCETFKDRNGNVKFKKFLVDPWSKVKNSKSFLPKQENKESA